MAAVSKDLKYGGISALTLLLSVRWHLDSQTSVQVLTHLRKARSRKKTDAEERRAAMTKIPPRTGKKRFNNGKEFPENIHNALVNMMINAKKRNGLSYPSEEAKLTIVSVHGLTLTQVNNFASNYRRRTEAKGRSRHI